MKKTDLFKANREMSTRVAEFMRTKVWGITLKARCQKEVKEAQTSIEGLKKLNGSILAEEGKKSILALEARITELNDALAKQLEEEAKFEYTQNDKDFYTAYKNATDITGVAHAIIDWFKVYGLEVTGDNDIVISIMDAISGKKKASAKVVINSGATKFVDEKRTKGDVLGLLYGTLAERMLEVGTLKPVEIQSDVREFYAPKQKKEKKESK